MCQVPKKRISFFISLARKMEMSTIKVVSIASRYYFSGYLTYSFAHSYYLFIHSQCSFIDTQHSFFHSYYSSTHPQYLILQIKLLVKLSYKENYFPYDCVSMKFRVVNNYLLLFHIWNIYVPPQHVTQLTSRI